MLPLEIALILAEVSATQLPYSIPNQTRKPLIDRRAERLIQWLILLNLPPLFFSTIGIAVFLSGTATPIVGLTEILITSLIAGTTIALYKRIRKIHRLSQVDYDEYCGNWLPVLQIEDLIASKVRAASQRTVLALIPLVTIVFAPSAIIEATQAIQLIRYFGSERHLWRTAQMLRIINVLLLLMYATFLAIIPLLSINRA
jgi:hypothetical protein